MGILSIFVFKAADISCQNVFFLFLNEKRAIRFPFFSIRPQGCILLSLLMGLLHRSAPSRIRWHEKVDGVRMGVSL